MQWKTRWKGNLSQLNFFKEFVWLAEIKRNLNRHSLVLRFYFPLYVFIIFLVCSFASCFFSLTFCSFLFLSKCWCTRSIECLVFADTKPQWLLPSILLLHEVCTTFKLLSYESHRTDAVCTDVERFGNECESDRERKRQRERERVKLHMSYLFNLLFYCSRVSSQFLFYFSTRFVHFEFGLWLLIVVANAVSES